MVSETAFSRSLLMPLILIMKWCGGGGGGGNPLSIAMGAIDHHWDALLLTQGTPTTLSSYQLKQQFSDPFGVTL